MLVYPGLVDTPMLRAFRERPSLRRRWRTSLNLMPVGRPERLARLIVRALQRGGRTVVYPRSFALAPHFPSTARWLTGLLFAASVDAPAAANRCAWWGGFGQCRHTSPTSHG